MNPATVGLALVALLAGSFGLALLIGRAVRTADERALPVRPVPARLDPRAGQNLDRAAHTTFTTVLALAVLAGVGIAQDVYGMTGGAQ